MKKFKLFNHMGLIVSLVFALMFVSVSAQAQWVSLIPNSALYEALAINPDIKALLVMDNHDYRFSSGSGTESDHMGTCLTLNGATQYATYADNANFDMGIEDFMISFWCLYNKTSATYDGVIVKSASGVAGGIGYWVYFYGGKINLYLRDVNYTWYIQTSSAINSGSWQHIVIVSDRSLGANSQIFVNGIAVPVTASGIMPTGTLSNGDAFYMGKANNYYSGSLDEIRLFKFGYDGLYVSGTYGGGNLILRVGTSTGTLIYNQANGTGLIPLLYEAPYHSLTDFGMDELEWANYTDLTSGTVTTGKTYIISTYVAGDDFTNIGAASNATKIVFIATGTTPTDWTNGSTLNKIGCVAHYNMNDLDALNGAELMPNIADRDFSASSAWYNGSMATYNETNDLSVSANAPAQACLLPAASFPTTIGKSYRLTFLSSGNFQIKSFDGTQTYLNPVNTNGTNIVNFTATTTGGIRIVSNASTSGDFDNFSLKASPIADLSSNGLGLFPIATPTTPTNYYLSPRDKEHIGFNTGSIESWIRPNWNGDDGVTHYLLTSEYNADNMLHFRKINPPFIYGSIFGGMASAVSSSNISAWIKGDPHHSVFAYNRNTIDGTDYTHYYGDGAEEGSSGIRFGGVQFAPTDMDIGTDDGATELMGSEYLRIFDRSLSATDVTALYNSGSPPSPVCDYRTKFILNGENNSSGYPKALMYPAHARFVLTDDASNTTLTVSVADALLLYNYALAFNDSVRCLVNKPDERGDASTAKFETFLLDADNIVLATGVITVSALTNETYYTTAEEAYIALNIVADGDMEDYGHAKWNEGSTPEYTVKDIKSKSGSQSILIEGAVASSRLYQSINIASGENYILSIDAAESVNYGKILWDTKTICDIEFAATPTDGTWTHFYACNETNSTGATLIKIMSDGDGAICKFDNISFTPSLVDNGGMESTDNYTASNATIAINSANERSGTNCLSVTATASNGYAYQNITTVTNQWYTFSGYGKATASDTMFVRIGSTTDPDLYYESANSGSTSYTNFESTFKATGTTTRIYLYAKNSGDIIYFDDFSLVPLIETEATTASWGDGIPFNLQNPPIIQ